MRLRYLAAGILVGIILSATALGRAGVRSLYRPLVHMQRVMGMRVAHHAPATQWFRDVSFGYRHPPHLRQFMCIHRGEGAWNAATGNGFDPFALPFLHRFYYQALDASQRGADH